MSEVASQGHGSTAVASTSTSTSDSKSTSTPMREEGERHREVDLIGDGLDAGHERLDPVGRPLRILQWSDDHLGEIEQARARFDDAAGGQ